LSGDSGQNDLSTRRWGPWIPSKKSDPPYGARVSPPLRRVTIAAVFENPLAGKAAGADLKPLIDYSLELGASLTKAALATLGASPC
jgi:hypothetical protein